MLKLTLDIALLIVFLVISVRVASSVRREALIFEEFKQPKLLAFLVFLFPFGPIMLYVLPHRVGWLPAAVIAAMCYLPALFNSRKRIKAFECSGTDRTQDAHKTAQAAFTASVIGLAYTSVIVLLFIATSDFGT